MAAAEPTTDHYCIFETAKSCRNTFSISLRIKNLMENEWAENRLIDFDLWSAGVGALANPEACLDTRLKNDSGAREVILSLLITLEAYMRLCQTLALPNGQLVSGEKCLSDDEDGSDEETTLPQAKVDTEGLIDELIRLGTLIRKSGTSSRMKRADRFFNPEDHAILRDHLTTVVLGRPPSIEAKRLLPNVSVDFAVGDDHPSPMQKRLITANLRRRNRFIYARNHGRKLAIQATENTSPRPATDNIPTAQQGPNFSSSDTKPKQEMKTSVNETPEVPVSKTGDKTSQFTKHSKVSGPLNLDAVEPTPSKKAVSQISATASRVSYPKMPSRSSKLESFTCPCCWQTLSSKMTRSQWQKHLANDITPYTCLVENCPDEAMLYAKREEWEAHMNECHQSAPYWKCFACEKPFRGSHGDSELVDHLKKSHSGIISQSEAPMMVSICLQKDPPRFESCPLCDWAKEQALRGHLAEAHEYSLDSDHFNYWECFLRGIPRHKYPEGDSSNADLAMDDERQDRPYGRDEETRGYGSSLCNGPYIFNSEEGILAHAANFHPHILDDDQLPEYAELCGARYPTAGDSCPLCSQPIGEMQSPDHDLLVNHMAEHLHSFALYSLPWPQQATGDTELHMVDNIDEQYFAKWDYFAEDDNDSHHAWRGNSTSATKERRDEKNDEQTTVIDRLVNLTPEQAEGHSPLSWAAKAGDVELAELLLNTGNAEVDFRSADKGRMPLSLAAYNGHETLVQLLLDSGSKIELPDDDGRTPLALAAEQGHEKVVETLLRCGADSLQKDEKDVTALHLAASGGHINVIRVLIDSGADVNAKTSAWADLEDHNRDTPLHWAAISGHVESMRVLIEGGAEIDPRNIYRRTPLHYAARRGHDDAITLLLDSGANIEAQRDTNETPLHFAVEENNYSTVQMLLRRGADINAVGMRGTPLDFAKACGHDEITALLLRVWKKEKENSSDSR